MKSKEKTKNRSFRLSRLFLSMLSSGLLMLSTLQPVVNSSELSGSASAPALGLVDFKADPALSKLIPDYWFDFSYTQNFKVFNNLTTGTAELKTCSTTATTIITDTSTTTNKVTKLSHTRTSPMKFEVVTHENKSYDVSYFEGALDFAMPVYFTPWLFNGVKGVKDNSGIICSLKDLPYYASLGKSTPLGQEIILNKKRYAYFVEQQNKRFFYKLVKALKLDPNSQEYKVALNTASPSYETMLSLLKLYITVKGEITTLTVYRVEPAGKKLIFTATLKKSKAPLIKPIIIDDYFTLLSKKKIKL